MPLEQLGPYRIERKIGRGGMGTVYYGVHCETGDEAAVKVLSGGLSADENFQARFAAEIETLKKLDHPHIVRLFGYGEQEGHLFYAMEFVEGRSLQDELSAGRRFQWREVARIGIDVCRALKHAHDSGVIHRDLKPANLLLDKGERVKLTDFGIARLFGVSKMTTTGGVMGTADYMSPEQAEGRRVDARSDLYSLGCVLYALLAGRPPFCADSLAEVLDKLRFAEPVPVGKRAEDVPAELERVITQLLAKDPRQRIPTSLAVAKRLEAMVHALSVKPESGEVLDVPASPTEATENGEFQLQDPDVATDEYLPGVPPIALRETIGVVPEGAQAAGQEQESQGADSAATGAGAADVAAPSPPSDSAPAGRFTTVEEETSRQQQGAAAFLREPTWWLKLAGLLAALGAAVWLAWVALRPPTADQLFERIESAGRQESADALVEVEDELQMFLTQFPGDPRAGDVRSLMEEIELYRLERRYQRQARRAGSHADLLPVERAYLEAMQLAGQNPELAAVRLEALLAVFGSAPQTDEQVEPCLELARRQLERLQADIDHWSHEHLKTILHQLDQADALDATDPAGARAIRQGVVELYGDKPWAMDAVARARESLPASKTPPE